MLSKYDPSLVSNPRDEVIRFVTGVFNLVREECHMAMLHVDMTLARLMEYAQPIEESKNKRMSRNLKGSGPREKYYTKIKNTFQTQDGLSAPKEKFERGGGSQNEKPTCTTFGKTHYGKCLDGTSG